MRMTQCMMLFIPPRTILPPLSVGLSVILFTLLLSDILYTPVPGTSLTNSFMTLLDSVCNSVWKLVWCLHLQHSSIYRCIYSSVNRSVSRAVHHAVAHDLYDAVRSNDNLNNIHSTAFKILCSYDT